MMYQMIKMTLTGQIPCIFHAITGLYCPGCGGTRAVKALLTGRIAISFLYHPLVLYCAVFAVWYGAVFVIYRATGKGKHRLRLTTAVINGGVVVTVINFVVKNFLLAVMGMDILEMLPKV